MAGNVFDKAARYAARLDPPGFLAWALGLPAAAVAYRGWLDTRSVPFPGDPERTGDTVARLDDPARNLTPWAVAVEFQTDPGPLMFGRLLAYLGGLWLALKPDPERGSRYEVGAVVLNLTGAGLASRRMEWPAAGLTTHLGVVERNLARENADELLAGIEAGRWSRGLLPWVPLMAGGDSGVIDRWKKLAETEPDSRVRSDFAGLAMVFADAADREAVWVDRLRGWNVRESSVVNEWLAEGEQRASAAAVIAVLEARFGQVPPDAAAAVRGAADLTALRGWVAAAATAPSLDDFRRTSGV